MGLPSGIKLQVFRSSNNFLPALLKMVSPLLVVVVFCLLAAPVAANADSAEVLSDMYVTLVNLVIPKLPGPTDEVYNRFIMTMPGKVLNYWDYYPGEDYEEKMQSSDSDPADSIPTSVKEKWFDLTDVIVGPDVFSSGVSPKSFAEVYESILSKMKVLGIDTKHMNIQQKYNYSLQYLAEEVPDPERLYLNATRLELYDRYQQDYADKKLDMENKLYAAKARRSSLEYEQWFQRNYPAMNFEVEGAYTKWLAFGQKELVESYKTFLDTGSGANLKLQDAREALKDAVVTSRGRTHNIYPVTFEPSNWYKYLLPSNKPPTRDMLLSQITMYQSEIDVLNTTIEINSKKQQEAEDSTSSFEKTLTAAEDVAKTATEETLNTKYACLEDDKTGDSDPCAALDQATDNSEGATLQKAQADYEARSASFLADDYNNILTRRMEDLQTQISLLQEELKTNEDAYLGGVVDSTDFQNLNKLFQPSEQDLNESWTTFEYNSEDSSRTRSTSTYAYEYTKAQQEPHKGMHLDTGVTFGAQELQQAMNRANLKVSGSVLRVVIKRPWFNLDILEDPSLYFGFYDENEQKYTFVSPGPLTQKEFKSAVGGLSSNLYCLPEYVSSFLLVKDLKLEFSGMDSASISRAMQLVAIGEFSGSYNMISLDAAEDSNKEAQKVTADRTTSGMIISVPGTQIIGYYTNVLPKFPFKQGE